MFKNRVCTRLKWLMVGSIDVLLWTW